MAANPDQVSSKRLDSWKEIAVFLKRGERTVKRWETERGLPVRRVPGGGRSAVFAYTNELADWLKTPGRERDSEESAAGETGAHAESALPQPLTRTNPARVTAWLVPLVLAAGLIAFLWIGHSASRFKAM